MIYIPILFIILYLFTNVKSYFSTFILFILILFLFKKKKIKKRRNKKSNNTDINIIYHLPPTPLEQLLHGDVEDIKVDETINEDIQKIALDIMKHFNINDSEQYDIIYNHLIKNNCLFSLIVDCNDLLIDHRLDIAQYFIWNSYNQEQIDNVYEMIINISNSNRYDNRIKSNAIDILLRSNNKKYINTSQVLLEKLRRQERVENTNNDLRQIRQRINMLQQFVPDDDDNNVEIQNMLMNLHMRETDLIRNHNRKSSVYNDSQNVHNHEINDSVINVATKLLSTNETSNIMNVDDELKKYYPEYENHKEQINKSLNRINNDSSKFKDNITMSAIYNKIIGIISNSKHKPEMIKRLGEELYDMNGLCSTGHLSRLVNVIQGFSDVPEELRIKINPKDEIYANIQTYLSNEIQKSHNYDQLMDDMVDTNKDNHKRFLDFVSIKMKSKVKELEKDYKDIIDSATLKLNVEDSLMNYLKNEQDVKYILA